MSQSSKKLTLGRYDLAGFMSLSAYAATSVIIPIALVPLSRDLGFPLEQGGMGAGGALQLGRSVFLVLSMVLCGFAAGKWGKKRVLGFALLSMTLGIIMSALSPIYGVLLIALLFAGFGEGFVEGLATPLIQDLHPEEPGRYINLTHGFWPLGVISAVVLSGFILSTPLSWRGLLLIVALIPLTPALLFLLPGRSRTPQVAEPQVHWTEVRSHSIAILRHPKFWIFFAAMFLAGGGEFVLTYWTASYIRIFLSDSVWAAGIGTAFFSGGMLISRLLWGFTIKQHQLKKLILLSAVLGVAMGLVLPLATTIWTFFPMIFILGFATGPFWPSIQSFTTDVLAETDTTMLFILLSCAGIPGTGFFSWFTGFLGDRTGLNGALFLVPLSFGLMGILVWLGSLGTTRQKSQESTS
jgi:MFS family permease